MKKTYPLKMAGLLRVLAARHEVPNTGIAALAARVKHLQRMGFPGRSNTGTGKAALYDADDVFRMMVAFEFIAIGINPAIVVRAIKEQGLAREGTLAIRSGLSGEPMAMRADYNFTESRFAIVHLDGLDDYLNHLDEHVDL